MDEVLSERSESDTGGLFDTELLTDLGLGCSFLCESLVFFFAWASRPASDSKS